MNGDINIYQNIDDFLALKGLPLSHHPDFYIVRFEDYPELINELGSEPYLLDYFEISLCIGYDVLVSVNNHTVNAQDNNLIFVSPRQIADWQPQHSNEFSTQEAVSFMLVFKPAFLPFVHDTYDMYSLFPFFNHNSTPVFQLSESLKDQFLNYLHTIHSEHKRNSPDSIEFIRNYLSLFLLTAKRELTYNQELSPYKTRAEEITYAFENTLKHTTHKHQPIAYYADQLNISSVYLSECIKKTTNKTAKQIIDEYFVMEAKSLLKHSQKSISELAFALGFDDDSNFVKYFRKHSGQTPRKFRESL